MKKTTILTAFLLSFTVGSGLLVTNVAQAAPLALSGLVTNAGNYSVSQLKNLGSTTENVTVGSVTDSYTGVSLWTLLGGTASGASSVIPGAGKNSILRDYVLATNSSGSQSLISLGEINPFFGGTGAPYLVAYEKNGNPLPVPQLIVPQDISGSRNLAGLTSLQVLSSSPPSGGPGGPSDRFTLSGDVNSPGTYNLSRLKGPPFQPSILTGVTFVAGGKPTPPTDYTGVPIWTLLLDAGLSLHDVLTSYLLATGTDGYEVLLSLAELNPAFGARPDLIAYADSAHSDASLGDAGFARLILPGDNRGGRFVSNLSELRVVNAVPTPGTFILLLPMLVVLFWSRKPYTLKVKLLHRP